MLGFLIGTACLIGLFKVVRRARYGYGGYGHFGGWHHGMHHGHFGRRCGHGPFGGGYGGPYGYEGDDFDGEDERYYAAPPSPFSWQGQGRRGFGGLGGFGLRAVSARLETTPGQEKVIKQAFDELRAKTRAVKDEARGMRGDLATALRGESLDAETLGTVASRASGAVDGVRDAAIGAILKIHDALDERQRAIAADMIESGPRFGRGWRGPGGPYRSAGAR
jgi:hypothetical protein